MPRSAEFIWTPDQPIASELTFTEMIGQGPVRRDDGCNRWYLFRKTFDLAQVPESSSLSVTTDGRYRIWLNGEPVGRGPSRCSPYYQRVDHYDVSDQVSAGENVLAVLVHVYGVDTAWYETVKDYWQALFGDGGLYCVLDATTSGARQQVVGDSGWRCTEALAWTRETPRSGWGQDYIEDFDARRMPNDWTAATFDDSNWLVAQRLVDERGDVDLAKGFGPIRAFPTLIDRDIPHLVETRTPPSTLLATAAVEAFADLPLDEQIYKEPHHDCPNDAVVNECAMLRADNDVTIIRTTNDRDIAVLVAFDELQAGYPYIEVEAHGGEVIEVAVAETYDGEFGPPESGRPRLVRRSFLDGAHVFRYTARAGQQYFEKFEWTGVRYLQLVVRNAPKGVKIRHVGLVATHYPVEDEGSYTCSDEFLNRLWAIGRHTVLQCSHDAWEDCPGREKRQWVGDGSVRYPIAAAAFGNSVQALDRRFLLQGLESQRSDGLLQMYAPGDHRTTGVVIPDYSLHFAIIAYDYLMQTGDLDTVAEILPGLQRILAWFSRHRVDSLLVDIPYWHFIEWADVGRSGVAASINALYCRALKGCAAIATHLGYERMASDYSSQYERTRKALNERFWDDERGVYVDCIDPQSGARGLRVSQQANSLLLLFDIAPEFRRDAVIDYICGPQRVKLTAVPPVVPIGEPFDEETDVVRCNTFFGHYLYSAIAHCGRFDQVLDWMREHYAPMLATGTSTLWESFDPSASLCHAFSATPVYQLSAWSLGVRPVAPGFTEFVVAPQFGDLESVNGQWPTPAGPVAVSWQVDDERVIIEIDVPPGISGKFMPPPGYVPQVTPPTLANGKHRIELAREADDG